MMTKNERPTFMKNCRFLVTLLVLFLLSGCELSNVDLSGTAAPTTTLDRITPAGTYLQDTAGRTVILRGLVVNTADSAGNTTRVEATDYQRMHGWGFNVQVIRLESCRLGAVLDTQCPFAPVYLERLDRMTTLAAQNGMYTIFKMTTYDAPSWGQSNATSDDRWQQFWDNEGGQQDKLIEGWTRVWQRFAGRPEVVGYDVLNEPEHGVVTDNFVSTYLTPYYNRVSTALRPVDPDVALIFQPLGFTEYEMMPIQDTRAIFAPHFYPRDLASFTARMTYMRTQATNTGAPLWIGEFGWPDQDLTFLPAWTPDSERLYASMIDGAGIGAVRPWYGYEPRRFTVNADGTDAEKMSNVARPYPTRIAGNAPLWSFEPTTRLFTITIQPRTGVSGPTEIFLGQSRHYPNGFTVSVNTSRFQSDSAQESGLRPLVGATITGLSYDAATSTLIIPAQTNRIIVTVSPSQ